MGRTIGSKDIIPNATRINAGELAHDKRMKILRPRLINYAKTPIL